MRAITSSASGDLRHPRLRAISILDLIPADHAQLRDKWCREDWYSDRSRLDAVAVPLTNRVQCAIARAHYEGLPVDFIAEAISTLGADTDAEFRTYNISNPHDDGTGMDEFVDWLIDAGHRIRRIADYDGWLQRFETALHALPEQQRQASLLPLLHAYRQPAPPTRGSAVRGERFRKAVQDKKIGPEQDIPHVTPEIIVKYLTDLQHLGLLRSSKCSPTA